MKNKFLAAAVVLAGCALEVIGVGSAAGGVFAFGLGLCMTVAGLLWWAHLRGVSRLIAITALIPYVGPALGLLVSPEEKSSALPPEAPLPALTRAGIAISVIGVLVAVFAAEPGLAVMVLGLSMSLASLKQGPGHGRFRAVVIVSGILIAAGLFFVRPMLGPGSLW